MPGNWHRGHRRPGAQDIAELLLTIDGKPIALKLTHAEAHTRPGAGGLPTLYLRADAHAVLPAGNRSRTFSLTDGTYAGRLGWHDEIVTPETEPTQEFNRIPECPPRISEGDHGY